MQFTGKLPRIPLALLKAIIAFGGMNIPEERLTDTLWPDAAEQAARFSLTSAIHRLRILLGQPDVVSRIDHKVSLNKENCWLDIWELEKLLDRMEHVALVQDEKIVSSESSELIREAAGLYRGPFLGNESVTQWAAPLADSLRRRMLRQLAAFGDRLQAAERWDEAALWYEKGLSVDPCAEDVCRQLMTTYNKLGRTGEIFRTYKYFREALQSLAGIPPSALTESLLQHFLKEK